MFILFVCTYFLTYSDKSFAQQVLFGSCYYEAHFYSWNSTFSPQHISRLCGPSWQPYGSFCTCGLQVNSRCAVKQKETFALMISCGASFCPFRFAAAHVWMLRRYVPAFGFWGQSNTSDMFCLSSVHILVPAKVALCSLRTKRLVPVWMHAVISMVLAIQRTSQALSALNTCNYSHYPQSPSALPLCLSHSLSLCSHSPLAHTHTHTHRVRGRLTSTKSGRLEKTEMCDRWWRKILKRNLETAKERIG